MTIAESLSWSRAQFDKRRIGVPQLTVEVLLSHLLGCERSYLYAHPERELSHDQSSAFEALVVRRLEGEPTQYITGVQEFYGREFRVTPDVMIPRPETEHVIEALLAVCPDARRIVDAGTGSGAIAVTAQLELGCEALATDVSRPALDVAAGNSSRLGAAVSLVACDLLSAVANRSVDVVASNPPYVPEADAPGLQREVRDFEPHVALFGGPDGLDNYHRLVEGSPRVLRPGGWLILELGIRQLDPVRAMLGPDWSEARVFPDLAGLPRVLAVQHK